MSILPGTLIPMIERVTPQTGVRHVERDPNADDFHRRHHQEADEDDQDEEDTPHDVVEVSGDYHPLDMSVPTARSSTSPTSAASASSPLERHIDITG